jgi:hypothetical protein
MTSTRKTALSSTDRWWIGFLFGTAVFAAPVLACASPVDLFYERTVMTAADQRCDLFQPQLSAALDAARIQSKGAALRAGADQDMLSDVARRAFARSNAAPCNSPDLALASKRIKEAFTAYSRMYRMEFPGDTANWMADRSLAVHAATWRLSQSTQFGWDTMTFGLAGRDGASALVATVTFADGAVPYGARLVLRDQARASRPYLNIRVADGHGKVPLTARAAPRSVSRVIMAEGRSEADATLLPAKTKGGLAFRWPAGAATAIADLDPREALLIEYLFAGRNGDTVRTAYIEVGDFAAGQAFLAAGQR